MSEADQAAIGQRYGDAARAGCLLRFRPVICLWVALSSHGPQRKRASDAFSALVSSVGHHIARGCSTSDLLRVISVLRPYGMVTDHPSMAKGERLFGKNSVIFLDIFAKPNDM